MPNGKRGLQASRRSSDMGPCWKPQQFLLVVILLAHIFEGMVLLAEMFDQSLWTW